MSLYFGNKKIGNIGITNGIGLDTSDADITPVEMQHGRIAYANGEKVIGTGKCFEFAVYGSYAVRKIIDSEGKERYGVIFHVGENANVVFVAPTIYGDIVLQENYIVNIKNGEVVKLGNNSSSGGEINAYYDKDKIVIYLTNFSQNKTILRLFVGKDNEI